jgi:uncharacterized membrane protein
MAGAGIIRPGAGGARAEVFRAEAGVGEAEAVFRAVEAALAVAAQEGVGDFAGYVAPCVSQRRSRSGRQTMTAGKFLKQLRHDDIVAAIREAEGKTSGEVRVFISRKLVTDAVGAAQAHFAQMGMEKTRERNGVLVFVAPRSHRFAVVGDMGVHTRCGESFWQELAAEMSGHFAKSEFTSGIIHSVKKAGELLARHFPRRPDDVNELPDKVAHD